MATFLDFEEQMEVDPSTKTNPFFECLFYKETRSDKETADRPKIYKSGPCGGHLVRFDSAIEIEDGELYDCVNLADLILARGFGEMDFNWEGDCKNEIKDKKICSAHFDGLGKKFSAFGHVFLKRSAGKRQVLCSLPTEICCAHADGKRPLKKAWLTKGEARALRDEHGTHVFPGTPVCMEHKELAKKLEAEHVLFQCWSQNSQKTFCSPTKTMTQGSDFVPEHEEKPNFVTESGDGPNGITEQIKTLFFEFASALGMGRLKPRKPFQELTQLNQYRKALKIRFIIEQICKIVASDSPKILIQMVYNNEKETPSNQPESNQLENMLQIIGEEYRGSTDSFYRRNVLSVVANVIPYKEVVKYIRSLSSYAFYQAKRQFYGAKEYSLTERKERYSKSKVDHFLDFLMSPHRFHGSTVRKKDCKNDNRIQTEIPATLRMMRNPEIITTYETYLLEHT